MDWIDHRLVGYGYRIACYEAGRCWTYKKLCEEVDGLAKIIAPVVRSKPAVIAIRLDSTFMSIAALLAITRLKQVALPLSAEVPAAGQREQQYIAGTSFVLDENGFRAFEASPSIPKLINQLSECSRAGLILFSSGTSGEPKGMLHDLNVLLDRYQTVQARSDRTVQLLLVDHIGGLDSALRTLFAGSTLIVPKSRAPRHVGEAIERYQANILPASPTFLNLMLLAKNTESFDCSSLKVIAYGAEPMPKRLLERLIIAFPHVKFQQKFGISETGAIRIKSQSRDSLYFRIEDSDVEWRVIEGELWLKTSSRILGYLNADNTSLEVDGWYKTGDLVEEADGGYLRIIGRHSDLINVGGQKVHPVEVEQVIVEIAGVDACAVFSKSAAVTGSVVACRIITSADQDARAWKRTIRNHCRGRLARWKIPVIVELSDQLSVTDRLKRG